jgi:hypothetical protein
MASESSHADLSKFLPADDEIDLRPPNDTARSPQQLVGDQST